MPSKLEIYIWLSDALRHSRGLTLEEIGRAWERSSLYEGKPLTLRSFHRYRRELEERFGLRIRCDRHDFTYRIVEGEDGGGGDMQSWLLDTLAVDNLLKESRDLQDRILFEHIPSGQRHLARIIGAMRDGMVLEMQYARFSDEVPYTTWLHPYFVKVFNQRWYVIGPTGRHPQAPHVDALDRVLSLSETGDRFAYPPDFRPADFFADSYGIFHSTETAGLVYLRAGARQAQYMRSLPIHASQYELSAEEARRLGWAPAEPVADAADGTGVSAGSDVGAATGTMTGPETGAACRGEGDGMGADGSGAVRLRPGDAIFSLRLIPTLDFIQYLLSQGDELEVLAPESLRADLARRARAIAALYR